MRRAESITAGWIPMKKHKIAVLDDYQNVALESVDRCRRRGRSWDRSGSHGVQVGPHDRIYMGADLGLRATYRDGEQLRPIRGLAANSGHGSAWKDPGRSGTWAGWITGRADWERFWNESDRLEPEHDARGCQSSGRNPGLQGSTVRAGRHPDDPFGVEQPYARHGRHRGAGENEANGPVDQCVARADRRRASFDQRVEEQANRRCGDRRIRF